MLRAADSDPHLNVGHLQDDMKYSCLHLPVAGDDDDEDINGWSVLMSCKSSSLTNIPSCEWLQVNGETNISVQLFIGII